jgi:hypothetical protein
MAEPVQDADYERLWPVHPKLSRLPWKRARQMRENESRFSYLWGDLARYNAGVSQGIEFTAEFKARMAQKQADYDRIVLRHSDGPGCGS